MHSVSSAQALADEVVREVRGLWSLRRPVVVGIPGGRSIQPVLPTLLHALEREVGRSQAPGGELVRFVLVDERRTASRDELNETALRRHFLDSPFPLCVPEHKEAAAFTAALGAAPGARTPAIDVGVYGVGADGHIASLFPGHEALESTQLGYIDIVASPKPPPERVTVSPALVRGARLNVLLFVGPQKRPAWERFLDEQATVRQCPARLASPVGDDQRLVVFADL